jgi:stearoyl-CoA desaturase (delta-9 desaturase)
MANEIAMRVAPKAEAAPAEPWDRRRYVLCDRRLTARYQFIGRLTFGVPAAGTVLAIAVTAARGSVGAASLVLAALFYVVSVLGLEVGYHRHFTHGAFDAPGPVRVALGICGAFGVSGPVTYWVATHRLHHMRSDRDGDPHSPYLTSGKRARLRGLWHAQVGWMLHTSAISNPTALAPDLLRDRVAVWLSRHYSVLALLGFCLPGALGVAIGGAWGLLECLLWGGFVRIFLVQLLYTGGLNSICHLVGRRDFATPERSTNTAWLMLPTLGQSWHNNHHAFPSAAKLRFRWYQLDLGGCVVACLAAMRLARNVKVPSPELIARKRRAIGEYELHDDHRDTEAVLHPSAPSQERIFP